MPWTARSMTPAQILARDICWAGFSREGRKGKTKNRYWQSLPEETRASYVEEAERIVWVLQNVSLEALQMLDIGDRHICRLADLDGG